MTRTAKLARNKPTKRRSGPSTFKSFLSLWCTFSVFKTFCTNISEICRNVASVCSHQIWLDTLAPSASLSGKASYWWRTLLCECFHYMKTKYTSSQENNSHITTVFIRRCSQWVSNSGLFQSGEKSQSILFSAPAGRMQNNASAFIQMSHTQPGKSTISNTIEVAITSLWSSVDRLAARGGLQMQLWAERPKGSLHIFTVLFFVATIDLIHVSLLSIIMSLKFTFSPCGWMTVPQTCVPASDLKLVRTLQQKMFPSSASSDSHQRTHDFLRFVCIRGIQTRQGHTQLERRPYDKFVCEQSVQMFSPWARYVKVRHHPVRAAFQVCTFLPHPQNKSHKSVGNTKLKSTRRLSHVSQLCHRLTTSTSITMLGQFTNFFVQLESDTTIPDTSWDKTDKGTTETNLAWVLSADLRCLFASHLLCCKKFHSLMQCPGRGFLDHFGSKTISEIWSRLSNRTQAQGVYSQKFRAHWSVRERWHKLWHLSIARARQASRSKWGKFKKFHSCTSIRGPPCSRASVDSVSFQMHKSWAITIEKDDWKKMRFVWKPGHLSKSTNMNCFSALAPWILWHCVQKLLVPQVEKNRRECKARRQGQPLFSTEDSAQEIYTFDSNGLTLVHIWLPWLVPYNRKSKDNRRLIKSLAAPRIY